MVRTALLVALLLVSIIVVPAAASPQPTPICRFCGSAFEDVANEQQINVTVVESSVTVDIHDDGTATWTVRNRLADGGAAFEEYPNALERIARRLLERGYGLPSDSSLVSVRSNGDGVVLTVRDDDAVERHVGLLVVTHLHDRGYERWYVRNADQFTIRGPEGSVVTNTPDSGRVDGRTVTWQGTSDGSMYQAPDLDGSPYVVFGSDHSAVTTVQTKSAIALATLPIVVRSLQAFLLWQTAMFALVLAGVVTLLRRRAVAVDVHRPAVALVVLGVLGVVLPVAFHGPKWVSGPPLFALGVGLLASYPSTRVHLDTTRGQVRTAAGLLGGLFTLLMAIHAVLELPHIDPVAIAFRSTLVGLPLAAMLPLGSVLESDRVTLLRWAGITVAAFAVVPLAIVNPIDPLTGMGAGLYAIALLVGAVLAPLVGSLLLVLGRALTGGDR